jgi:hypothetical protein
MQCFREIGWKLPHFCQKPLSNSPLSPIGQRPISRIFHPAQPTGTFAQWVLVLLGILRWLSNSLWELPRGYPITFEHFSAAFLHPSSIVHRLSNSLSENFLAAIGLNVAISILLLWSPAFLFIFIKSKTLKKNSDQIFSQLFSIRSFHF